jgi:hypothetical protein
LAKGVNADVIRGKAKNERKLVPSLMDGQLRVNEEGEFYPGTNFLLCKKLGQSILGNRKWIAV